MAEKLNIIVNEKKLYKMKDGKVTHAEDASIEKAEANINLLNLLSSKFYKKGKKGKKK
jgi:hypothetical protein